MIKCIAIDDEPLALKQMAAYIDKTPYLELAGQFESALEAIEFVRDMPVQLIFLDINMPDLNGLEFIKSLPDAPGVIFTTAYSEYALEGFRVDAIDYMLKPIGYSDFLRAAEKARERLQPRKQGGEEKLNSDDNFLFIKSEYKIIRIILSDIKYIEGMREYLRIHLVADKPIMTLMSFKKMEEHLPSHFMRVHRSYIVNLHKITTVERSRIVFDGKVYIPIGEQYKATFQKFLDDNFLV